MIRVLFWLILAAALALGFTQLSRTDNGYLLAVFPPWRVEMSLTLAFGLLVLSHVLFYILARVLRTALRLPRDVRRWRERRRRERAEEKLERAVAALLAGEKGHALDLARQSWAQAALPLAALTGARAALELGDLEAVQGWLDGLQTDVGELIAARQALARQAAARAAGPSPPPGRRSRTPRAAAPER